MSLFQAGNTQKYDVKLVKQESKSKSFTLGEPFAGFKDFDACLAKLGSERQCGAL